MTPERNAVAPETPIARRPNQTKAPRQMPQTAEVKPGLKAGGRGGNGTPPTLVSRAATCAITPGGCKAQARGVLSRPRILINTRAPCVLACLAFGSPVAGKGRPRGTPNQDQKNSPSGWRFRPLHRPAFRLHVQPPGEASTYSRSLLGAIGTLANPKHAYKGPFSLMYAICEMFSFPHFPHPENAVVGRAVERRYPSGTLR